MLVYLSRLLPLVILFLVVTVEPAAAYKIKDCGPLAEDGINDAAGFITRKMSRIVDSYHYLSAKQRQEIVAKWPNLTIDCADESSTCRKGANGFAQGGPGNQINICYLNLVDQNWGVCALVGLIMHEVGHAHGFRSTQGHNDPTPYIEKHDTMYRMKNDAKELCLEVRPKNQRLPGKERVALGGTCKKNTDCKSGDCEQKVCVCNDDGDCDLNDPSRPICHIRATNTNFCGVDDKKVGQTCSKDGQCASGACQSGRCACKSNKDCPDEGIRTCHKRTFDWNFCGSTSKAIGQSCSVNAQCASDKCKNKKCVKK